jgi:hypothetical protein
MKIKILNHGGKIFLKPSGDHPWNSFFEEFEKFGFKIVSKKFDLKYEILICNGHISKIRFFMIQTFIKPKLIYLILWEPIETNPQIYNRKYLENFNFIFSPTSNWINGENLHFFNWPQGTDVAPIQSFKDWSCRSNKVICIYANKFSVIKGELYSLRRSVLTNTKINKDIELYGRNWNRSYMWNYLQIFKSLIKSNRNSISLQSLRNVNPNLQNYRGSILNKAESIRNYRISLIIENSSNYISEKLFDALVSQSIAIYVGIDLSKIALSNKIAIQINQNSNLIADKISKIINLSDKEQYDIFVNQQEEFRKFLCEWNNDCVFSKLAKDICKLSTF